MKAFISSVVAAVLIAVGAALVLDRIPHDSAHRYISPTADVRL
jgi:hypothetical protein